jgi:hypothetical protein
VTEVDVHIDRLEHPQSPRRPVYIGDAPCKDNDEPVEGGFVDLGGERLYRISRFDRMEPFFMSIVSSSDHWMFVSSTGALTAGRRNPEHSLFPYYTVDKIHDSAGITGGKTLILADVAGRLRLWEPFARDADGIYDVERNLYKNTWGNRLLFEEVNNDLGLIFRALWTTSERFGFVRHSLLINSGEEQVTCSLLDGIQNVLPFGVDRMSQNVRSTLLDAYKKNELVADTGLGLFLLSSIPVDKPEPSEALSATTAWSVGLEDSQYLLSTDQLDRFRRGEPVRTETDVRARRGAYFVGTQLTLREGEATDWYVVADVNQDPADVAELRFLLADRSSLRQQLERDMDRSTENLLKIVAAADGLQKTSDELVTSRHFSNALFNVMRGGTFADGYRITKDDLVVFVRTHNRIVMDRHRAFFDDLDETLGLRSLLEAAKGVGDPDLIRLCREYLPLTFSRRHGDPSRPWNNFSIDVRSDDGGRVFNY